jgi:probable phosphoglycerate mutase
LLVRHGETSWNVLERLQGQTDVPLNALGRAQARAAGAFLSRQLGVAGPSVPVVASDLCRAFATAEAICAALGGAPPAREPRLRETHMGSWQGRSWAEIEAATPQDVRRWKAEPDFAIPGAGGESVRARFHRVACALHEAALAALAPTAAGARGAGAEPAAAQPTVIIVTHGGVLDDILRLARGLPFAERTGQRKVNCAVHVLDFAPSAAAEAAACGSGGSSGGGSVNNAVAAMVAAVFLRDSIEPRAASVALGAWDVAAWGLTTHLDAMTPADVVEAEEGVAAGAWHAPLQDPLADAAAWGGR